MWTQSFSEGKQLSTRTYRETGRETTSFPSLNVLTYFVDTVTPCELRTKERVSIHTENELDYLRINQLE